MNVLERAREEEIKNLIFNSSSKSGSHSYKRAEKLYGYINNSDHWHNQHFNEN